VIFGIGTDVFQVDRIEKMAAAGRQHLEAVFTKNEIEYCEAKARRSEHYAARYAAKEAFLKALGSGWRNGLAFPEIEILNEEQGQPRIFLHGEAKRICDRRDIRRILVSLSHTRATAVAFVILEK
jgi:holo-[acyl-carrier protein] synthase